MQYIRHFYIVLIFAFNNLFGDTDGSNMSMNSMVIELYNKLVTPIKTNILHYETSRTSNSTSTITYTCTQRCHILVTANTGLTANRGKYSISINDEIVKSETNPNKVYFEGAYGCTLEVGDVITASVTSYYSESACVGFISLVAWAADEL